MTPAPVDLTNLREMTDGDRDFELQMFEAFLASSTQCLEQLDASLAADDITAWRSAAHAFKGVAYNLGAAPLAELCKQAQEGFEACVTVKTQQLKAIHSAYDECEHYLTTA